MCCGPLLLNLTFMKPFVEKFCQPPTVQHILTVTGNKLHLVVLSVYEQSIIIEC